ncbi:efflux RND transporter periplasmic adaptor subunit [Nitrospirillum bahiense]|uniref:HlyD family secretion protein n=1 Tax=Nitrospirillum amazonense TaxID=28077 RepID=A0A560G6V8_9PROT|nr:HlyD family efflux transporter periplasmic adaptor subunit [Nitrospirillum amazonense]TWB29633.1 HlyD family secretion protein [Nitrospirillum amazonense]
MRVVPPTPEEPPQRPDAAELAGRQLFGLTTLLQLQKRARHTRTGQELGFLMVNDTFSLVRYRQALAWQRTERGDGAVLAVSGLSSVDADSPYARYACRLLAAHGDPAAIKELTTADLAPDLAEEWPEYLPAHGLWLPLTAPDERSLGGLLLAREEPWTDGERVLLENLGDAYAHAWGGLVRQQRRWHRDAARLKSLRTLGYVAAGLVALSLFPVRLSALAPAEVIPQAPTVVRAPFDGVVDKFLVTPNQPVTEDQPLFQLDPVRLQNRLDVAQATLEAAEAEYRQTAQQAVFDEKAKGQLVVLQGKRDQAMAEVTYVQDLLKRIVVHAPRAGLAVFTDVNDWIGRPVTQGERILMVAEPKDVELEIKLPVADAIAMDTGDPVSLFLNIDPQHPLDATVRLAAYQPEVGTDGVAAYRLKARFNDGQAPVRIGLQGTAKIYGQRTTLFYYLFRRPLAALRQRLGV